MDNGWDKVNLSEVLGSAMISLGVGMIRLLTLIRDKRKVRWVEIVLEPSLAVFAGMLIWAVTEYTSTPDVLQAALTSLGAWGGPRTIHMLEVKYFGGSRKDEGKLQVPHGPDV